MYIIGDNQGGNIICGRQIYYGTTVRCISKMFDAGPEQYAKPKIGACKRILMQDVINNG